MLYFLGRRFLQSVVILLILSLIMYLLVNYTIDPLADLRQSTAPNKQQLINTRIAMLDLDKPVLLRYLWWLGGVAGCLVGHCDLGTAWQENQRVTTQLSGAMAATFELVFAATIIAILLGVVIGLVSALRQYSGFDYFIIFVSFVMYSLPVFWVAVLLKQYLAIDFNTFLSDPRLSWPVVVVLALLAGLFWTAAVGGSRRRRWAVFGAAAAITLGTEVYVIAGGWLDDPRIGIIGVAVIAAAAAIAVTFLSAGLQNKRALYSAFAMGGLGVLLYYPLQYFFSYVPASAVIILGLFVLTLIVGAVVGVAFGGPDPGVSVRGTMIVGIVVSFTIFVDRTLQIWNAYVNSDQIHHRPVATISSSTPNLGGDFWVGVLDTFMHLLLPSVALILIAFAEFTRFTRASMLEVMSLDYIRTARAKGLGERTVVMRHALRNSLLPLASIVPVSILTIVGGAIITETIFGWYGMGRLFYDSLRNNEIDPVMAYIMIVGALAVLANLLADILYTVLDPRIRVGS